MTSAMQKVIIMKDLMKFVKLGRTNTLVYLVELNFC